MSDDPDKKFRMPDPEVVDNTVHGGTILENVDGDRVTLKEGDGSSRQLVPALFEEDDGDSERRGQKSPIPGQSAAAPNQLDFQKLKVSGSQAESNQDQDNIDKHDLAALPKVPALLSITCCLSLILFMGFAFSNVSGVGADLWMHLPMQLFWTFCIYRISQLMGVRYKDKAPLSSAEVAILSLVSFTCMPGFYDYHFYSRWFDPTFLAWLASQLYWPIKFGVFIDRHERTDQARWKSALELAAGCNGYVFLSVFLPAIMSVPWLFNPLWFVSNLWGISVLRSKVADKIAGDKKRSARSEQKVSAGNDIVIRYRAYAGIERWLQQRFSQQSIKKGLRLALMWIVIPIFMLVSTFVLNFFVLNPIANTMNNGPSPPPAAGGVLNFSFIFAFVLFTSVAAFLAYVRYRKQPTHIGVSEKGLRFLWRRRRQISDGQYLPWQQIKHISLRHPAGKTSPQDERLTFESASGAKMELKMGSIDSVEDKEALLKCIQKYAPDVSRDANVLQALQPPADYSYTELWLQALSAPPKRQRLQPLVTGALLHDENYRVLNSLGVGGQGQAYLALDKRTDETVVLKEFILPVYVDVNVRRNALEQFENEARILRQLEHPQIVKMVDFFIEDHRAYLVLEHIQGASLREIVKSKGKLSQKQVMNLALQMCKILKYLHSVSPPVVHRDFTPDNLILNVDGTLKLIDFNVAKQVVESTTSGTVVGKHAYLPPEQFRGMPVPQSDIYAMGGTLHYLLTGADPEPIAVSHPRQVAPEVSEGLNQAVEHATALNLDRRYKTIEELWSDLSRIST